MNEGRESKYIYLNDDGFLLKFLFMEFSWESLKYNYNYNSSRVETETSAAISTTFIFWGLCIELVTRVP